MREIHAIFAGTGLGQGGDLCDDPETILRAIQSRDFFEHVENSSDGQETPLRHIGDSHANTVRKCVAAQ